MRRSSPRHSHPPATAFSPSPSPLGSIRPPCVGSFNGFVAAVILASLFKSHQSRSPVPPPSSFPSVLKPVAASSANSRLGVPDSQDQPRRHSRTDLNFEEALASPDTIVLKEGIDLFSPEYETSTSLTTPPHFSSLYGNSPGASGKYEGSTGSPSPNLKGKSTVTPLKQPGTPNIIPATPTPPRNDPVSVLVPISTSSSNSTPFHTPRASPVPSRDGEDRVPFTGSHPSPQPSNSSQLEGARPPSYDAEEKEYQVRRRSMYRSPGSASSPDLVTLLKKTKQRNGSSNVGSNGTGNRDASRLDTSEGGNTGGNGLEPSPWRLRTTSATPSSISSGSVPLQGQRPRMDRIATNSSSSSYQRGDDSSNFLNARGQDWVLPSPSPSPTPSPSVLKVRFLISCIGQTWYLTST
jgi:hypothetical protein